ncbi:unnamed protein product [Closterium sp. NIES-53]
MNKYEVRWGRVFSRREEERVRREPSRERGRSWERSPRRPAFRADRVPATRDGRSESARADAEGTNLNAWLREGTRGTGAEGGSHRDTGVFYSPEYRGQRRDERGRWRGLEERRRRRGVNSSGDAREGGPQEKVARELTQERGAGEDEGADETQSEGTGEAETPPAEEHRVISQVAVAESKTPLQGLRDREGSRGEGQHAESSRRQERGAVDEGNLSGQAPRPRGKEEAERSRSSDRERRHGEWLVGELRPYDKRQEQGGWSGGDTRSPGQRQARGDGRREKPRSPRLQGRQEGRHKAEHASPERHGQQRRGHSSTLRSPGRPRQSERRDSSGSRSPDWYRTRRERTESKSLTYGAERAREAREGMRRARTRGPERGRVGGDSEAWGEGQGGASNTPRVEVPARFSGDQRGGPTLKNYLMQVGNVRYRCDRHNMDPVDFFLRLPNTLEGEAEMLYRMRMEELLWRAGRYGEDPTEAFLERLQRQFPGHTAERIREFQEFSRGRAESLLTYYNRLINVAEDVRCTDNSLLISKFLGGLDEALGGGLRMRVYELGAEASLEEVFDLAERVELAQRKYEAYLPRPTERSRRPTWAAAITPEGGGRTDARGELGIDTRTCHRCGQPWHLRRDCKNCDGCGKPGHRKRECPDAARCEICKKRGHEAKDQLVG